MQTKLAITKNHDRNTIGKLTGIEHLKRDSLLSNSKSSKAQVNKTRQRLVHVASNTCYWFSPKESFH